MSRQSPSGKRALFSLYSANALSLLGNVLSELAVPWFVYELTGSATATAGIIFAGQLPNILVGLFSGRFIDRFSAGTISFFTDVVNFLAVALIPLLFHLNALDMVLLGILVFFSKVFDTPGQTARQVIVTELIDEQGLPRDRVNGIYSLIETLADLLGPLVAGLLLTLIGAVYLMAIDGVTFALSLLIMTFGFSLKKHPSQGRSSVSLRDAWHWMITTPPVRKLALYDALVNTVATTLLAVTLPVLAKKYAGSGTIYGLWMASFAGGTTLTTALYAWIGHRLNPYTLLRITPLGQIAGLMILLAVLLMKGPMILGAVGLFLFGAHLGVGGMIDAKLLQTHVPEDRRGSIFAAFSSLRYAGVPLGLFAAGRFLDSQNLIMLFLFFFLLCLGASALWWKPDYHNGRFSR